MFVNIRKDRFILLEMISSSKNDVLIEYDADGNKMCESGYSGSMKKGFEREGKGKEFEIDDGTAVHIGEWGKGKRNGFGVEYKDQEMVFSGNWKNGKRNDNQKSKKQRLRVVSKKAEWLFGSEMAENVITYHQ